MISLKTTDSIIAVSLMFLAYIFSITTAGSIQSRVTKRMGDDTSSDIGFDEFNPFIHIGLLDIIFFILVEFMLGTPQPVETRKLKSNWFPLRLFLSFATRSLMYLVLATFSWMGLLIIVKNAGVMGTIGGYQPLMNLVRQALPAHLFVISIFLGAMTFVNVNLAAFSAIRDSVYGFIAYRYHKDPSFLEYANPLMLFGVLLLLILFGTGITALIATGINFFASTILHLIGL